MLHVSTSSKENTTQLSKKCQLFRTLRRLPQGVLLLRSIKPPDTITELPRSKYIFPLLNSHRIDRTIVFPSTPLFDAAILFSPKIPSSASDQLPLSPYCAGLRNTLLKKGTKLLFYTSHLSHLSSISEYTISLFKNHYTFTNCFFPKT